MPKVRDEDKMVIDGNLITLSRKEAKELIERECKERLNMSAAEFLLKYRRGELLDLPAVPEIKMLLRLVYR